MKIWGEIVRCASTAGPNLYRVNMGDYIDDYIQHEGRGGRYRS